MRSIAPLLLPSCLALGAILACNNATENSGGGGNTGVPTNVVIVKDAQLKGHLAFAPDTFTVSLAAGGKVKWANHDLGVAYGDPGVTHHLAADGGTFTSPNITAGGSYSFIFTAVDTVDYHCTIHPGMRGTIIVAP